MKHKQQDLNFEKKGENRTFGPQNQLTVLQNIIMYQGKKTKKKNYEVANDSPASLFLAGQQSHPRDQS